MAQALHVAIVVCATLSQWLDVVALCGQRDAAQAIALNAERVTREQADTHGLQASASDALGCSGFLCPGFTRMLAAPTGAIAYEYPTSGVITWFGCCLWHVFLSKLTVFHRVFKGLRFGVSTFGLGTVGTVGTPHKQGLCVFPACSQSLPRLGTIQTA